jgi:hypothetical protein
MTGLACMLPAGKTLAPACIGERREPHETQNRLPTGLRVEQVEQTGPSSERGGSKPKVGASGRAIILPAFPVSPKGSAGSGTTPSPVGGVGGTIPAGEAKRRPQS